MPVTSYLHCKCSGRGFESHRAPCGVRSSVGRGQKKTQPDVIILGIIFYILHVDAEVSVTSYKKKVCIRRFKSCPIWLDGVAKLVRQNSYESISDTQNILDMSYGAVGEWFMPAVLKTAEA